MVFGDDFERFGSKIGFGSGITLRSSCLIDHYVESGIVFSHGIVGATPSSRLPFVQPPPNSSFSVLVQAYVLTVSTLIESKKG